MPGSPSISTEPPRPRATSFTSPVSSAISLSRPTSAPASVTGGSSAAGRPAGAATVGSRGGAGRLSSCPASSGLAAMKVRDHRSRRCSAAMSSVVRISPSLRTAFRGGMDWPLSHRPHCDLLKKDGLPAAGLTDEVNSSSARQAKPATSVNRCNSRKNSRSGCVSPAGSGSRRRPGFLILTPRNAGHASAILSHDPSRPSMSQRDPIDPIAELSIAENVTIP